MNSIILDKVCKRYGDNLIIDKVSATFQAGMIYGVVGRNGCGKSVLFKSIAGLVSIDSGSILVNSQIVTPRRIPTNIRFIIESPGFLENLSGYKNLKILSDLGGSCLDKRQINNIMTSVGLDPYDTKNVGKYSIGMKQRLGIAQSIMDNPDILLLDEPTNGLDDSGVEDIRKLLLHQCHGGKIVILSSHNNDDIKYLCSSVYHLQAGKLQRRS